MAGSSPGSEGRTTRHSFSFGDHYDPENVGFGPMVCHDDHLLRGGAGFPDHPHRDLEIVTWVLSGAVVHTASVGPPTTRRRGSGPGALGRVRGLAQ